MSHNLNAAGAPALARQPVELAGLRRRLASMLYESLLLLGVLALTFMVPLLIVGVGMEYTPPGSVLWIYIFVVLGLYFLWYWRQGGQTLAMQTWKLRLVNIDGEPIGLKQGWLRYALAWPCVLFFGVGLIWAVLDRDRQFLHDRLAGTRLVLLLTRNEG
ncbi:RDD family protein [Zoogloea sp.]|uniref:RDD family protein n=1 Tax=Zoogloea sp. TaxID=49181 RepID=UPI0035B4DEEE|nr:RDD family protein [Rhodocyclales bacterium]